MDKKAILLYANDRYSWNPGVVFKLDAEEFDELIHKAQATEKYSNQKSHSIYQKALELYKGDYCADTFDQWCEQKRIYYRELCFRILKKIAGYQFDNKRYGKSLSLYRRALTFNKFDESIRQGIRQSLAKIKNP
jgi:two-component SAPR family response regulator